MSSSLQTNTSTLWMQHMRRGAFKEAWIISDKALKARAGKPCWHLPRHFQNVWTGDSLQNKRVLVRCYHGLGDTIQFIRYVPLLKRLASEVIVWTQPSLLPLFKTISEIDKLLPLHNGAPEIAYDVDVEIMELSHIFRTTLATIPSKIPYLHVDSIPLSATQDTFSVGLVWKAGEWDELRSIPFSLLLPLSQIQGITFFILQANPQKAGWNGEFGSHLNGADLYADARIIKALDLLISVDTMPAHLAGALGVPVWTLLYSEADWRWMDNRSDSPWYSTMRLFRQEQAGNWKGVIETVKHELEKEVKSRLKE